MCKFNEAWIGICKEENVNQTDYCEKHLNIKCDICGNQATHNCAETMQLVCGVNLCDSEECRLEHFYRTHGYAIGTILYLEEKLGLKSIFVVGKEQYETSNKFYDWYNKKYKDALQVMRVVYKKDDSVKVYDANYRYMAKEKSEIPQLFKNTFYEDEIKKMGVYFTDEIIYLDREYTENNLPKLELVELN